MSYYNNTAATCPRCGRQYNRMIFSSCPYCPQPPFPTTQPYQQPAPYPQAQQTPSQFSQPSTFAQPLTYQTPQTFGQPAAYQQPHQAPGQFSQPPAFTQSAPPANTQQKEQHIVTGTYVVGWLVGISGTSKGSSFEVRKGCNEIMNISGAFNVKYSTKASQSAYSRIIFDPANDDFMYLRGGSTDTITVNDAPLSAEPLHLTPYSQIAFGSSKLLFIPLCGKNFSWNDPEKKITAPSDDTFHNDIPAEKTTASLSVEEAMTQSIAENSFPPIQAPAPAVLKGIFGSCADKRFEIHEGFNSIGRTSGDIIIPDSAVSSENDCGISYDPETGGYSIVKREGKNTVSLNGVEVTDKAELKPGDKITVGSTILELTLS